jgi:hypothetical protein
MRKLKYKWRVSTYPSQACNKDFKNSWGGGGAETIHANIYCRKNLISGFRRDFDEICPLLGCYAASCGNCLPTFRDNVSVPSSRVGSPETSVNNYYTTPRNIPEERRSKIHRYLKDYRSLQNRIANFQQRNVSSCKTTINTYVEVEGFTSLHKWKNKKKKKENIETLFS